jgi:hypothetical protein
LVQSALNFCRINPVFLFQGTLMPAEAGVPMATVSMAWEHRIHAAA